MSEFALIRRIIEGAPTAAPDVVIGPGDDAAVLAVPAGHELVLTTDTLVAGRHFPAETAAADIGWKALAVNLSDLAAMGAAPRWITVALTLPSEDEAWLAGFVDGLAALLTQSGCVLVGGDLTRGPLAVTVQAAGLVPAGGAIPRGGARPGDLIAVTGTLGDASLALALRAQGATDSHAAALRRRLDRPEPRIDAGLALRGAAHAAADISDGLGVDLAHILEASGVGATVEAAKLPASDAFAALCPPEDVLAHQWAGGDDYELCVCLPEAALAGVAARVDCPLRPIGRIEAQPGLRLVDAHGTPLAPRKAGYDHFIS